IFDQHSIPKRISHSQYIDEYYSSFTRRDPEETQSTRLNAVQTRSASGSQPIHNRKDRIWNGGPLILDSKTIGRGSREGEHPDLATQSERDHEQTRHLCLQNPTSPRRCGSDEKAR